MPKKRGPKKGCQKRKSPWELRIEATEDRLQKWIRGFHRPVTTDTVIIKACQFFKADGLGEYYLCKHGPGTNEAASWMTKFKRRHGFLSKKQTRRYRSRRKGIDLRRELFKCWRRCEAGLRSLARGMSRTPTYYYINSDESGVSNIQPGNVVVGQEQVDQRAPQLHLDNTSEKWSVLFTVTSDPRLQVPPLILMEKCRNYQKDTRSAAGRRHRTSFSLRASSCGNNCSDEKIFIGSHVFFADGAGASKRKGRALLGSSETALRKCASNAGGSEGVLDSSCRNVLHRCDYYYSPSTAPERDAATGRQHSHSPVRRRRGDFDAGTA